MSGTCQTRLLPCELFFFFCSKYLSNNIVLLFGGSVVSDSLRPRGLQHTRPPRPLSPGVCSDSCPLSQWFHPTSKNNTGAIWTRNLTSGRGSKGTEMRTSKTDLRLHVHYSTVHNRQDVEATYMLTDKWTVIKGGVYIQWSFPGGSVGKESACQSRVYPGLGRSLGERKRYPLQYSGLENSMDCMGLQRGGHDWETFPFIFRVNLHCLLVSAVQQSDSVMHIYILFHVLFYYGLSPTTLDCNNFCCGVYLLVASFSIIHSTVWIRIPV